MTISLFSTVGAIIAGLVLGEILSHIFVRDKRHDRNRDSHNYERNER